MPQSFRRSPLSGAQLVAALAAILVATGVLPPLAAWKLNQNRVTQTEARVRAAVARLQISGDDLRALERRGGVVCGPGRLPDSMGASSGGRAESLHPTHSAWLREAASAPQLFGAGMPTDAWGRCFLLNADALTTGGPVWMLSAGPNGLLDTPPNALALGGDDIGGRLR